jgi:hypothetical protein
LAIRLFRESERAHAALRLPPTTNPQGASHADKNRIGHHVALTGDAAATTTASVSDSIISGVASGDACVFASASQAGAALRVFVSRSTLSSCNYGIDSQTNGTGAASVALSASMVVNNNFAWFQDGAGSAIRTLGNNHITDNASTFGALTSTAQQ